MEVVNFLKHPPFDEGGFLCPMSVGNKNSYGHPSPIVISELFLKRNFPILVTEDDTFEEHIY